MRTFDPTPYGVLRASVVIGLDPDDALAVCSGVCRRPIESFWDLNMDEAERVAGMLGLARTIAGDLADEVLFDCAMRGTLTDDDPCEALRVAHHRAVNDRLAPFLRA